MSKISNIEIALFRLRKKKKKKEKKEESELQKVVKISFKILKTFLFMFMIKIGNS